MRAGLGDPGPFACSCLPFPGPQRPIKGALMENDKHQPTPLLSICVSPQHAVCPQKKSFFLDCFNIPPLLFFLSPSHERNQESLFRLKVGQGCTPEIHCNTRASLAKRRRGWGWCLCFIAFKIHQALVCGWFHSSVPKCHFQFQRC